MTLTYRPDSLAYMADLKDIAATLAVLGSITLTLPKTPPQRAPARQRSGSPEGTGDSCE